jgi:hypothetical protein
MPRRSDSAPEADDAPLKRLGGGRWQTRDERFTIEPQSGTWVVVDAEQTDDLGLPLVRGPYRSLTDAKAAITSARTSAPAESPLAASIERRRSRPAAATKDPGKAEKAADRPTARSARSAKPARRARTTPPELPEPSPEPAWLADLAAPVRGRARRLIDRLEGLGVPDAISVVRRDVVGDVPAVAAAAIGRRLDQLDPKATIDEVVALLSDGHDEELGVRWRLVDGDDRPILLDRSRKRRR